METSPALAALKRLRLGELRDALAIITTDAYSEVARAMPMYSDMLRMPMESRRGELAAALRAVAAKLQDQARELT